MACAAVRARSLGAHRHSVWGRSGMDYLARGSGRGAAWSESLGQWAWFLGAEVVSDWAGRDVDCSLVRRGFVGQEYAQPGTPEFRICDRGPLSRIDQPDAGH